MAELGESGGSGSGDDGKVKPHKFAARITSVDFIDSVTVGLDGARVSSPHWTLAGKDDILQDWSRLAKRIKAAPRSYSKKPAAYTLPGGRKVKLEIEVTLSENVSGSGKVEGTFGPLIIKGTCPTAVGKHTVDATITAWADAIDAQVGKMAWFIHLKDPAVTWSLGSTFVEVYLLMDKPAKMYSGGVPAEALRFLTLKAKVLGKKTAHEVGIAVTTYLHSSHGMKYDVTGGASFFDARQRSTSNFSVVNYAFKQQETVNCYDQAAAVQSLSGAVGAVIGWIFMQPYGYINPTSLVGVKGICNNPFYLADPPHNTNLPHIAATDPRRTAFYNHAYCSLAGNIFDACAGPHLGTENLDQYISAAIDHKTALNASSSMYPGTAASANSYPGVVSTTLTNSV